MTHVVSSCRVLLALIPAAIIAAGTAIAGSATSAPTTASGQQRADTRAENEVREQVLAWIRDAAVPLRTVQPGGDTSDLAPLRDWIGDARIVALGEATHGTEEFFRMKHRVFEYLVEEMGFTAFAFEAMLPESLDINRYVHTGEGDPRGALTGQYFWVWDTVEVLDLIEWMRSYNADPRNERKVSFYGYDMQQPTRAAKVAFAALERIAPESAARMRGALTDVLDPFLAADARNWSKERKVVLRKTAAGLLAELDARGSKAEALMGKGAWDVAHRHAVVLTQFAEFIDQKDLFDSVKVRDRTMADNVDWILEREARDARVVLWAHNFHVSSISEPIESMGHVLRMRHGDDMFVFAFAFNEGGFQSRELPISTAGDLKSFVVPPAPETSFDGIMSAAGLQLAALNLHSAPDAGPVRQWLAGPNFSREFGSGYQPAADAKTYFREVRFAQAYDAVFFVNKTHAAVSNSPWVSITPPLDAPMNGGFEEQCGAMGAPQGWNVERKTAEFGFRIATESGAAQGHCALSIRRVTGQPRYGEAARGVSQRVKAGPFQGHTVTLAASTLQRLAQDGAAHLWINASRNEPLGDRIVASRIVSLYPADAGAWTRQQLSLDIPADADTLAYGLSLVGGGEVRLDDVTVQAAHAAARR